MKTDRLFVFLLAAAWFTAGFNLALVLSGCDEPEPYWIPPGDRHPLQLSRQSVSPYTDPIGIESIPRTNGDPREVARVVREHVRWRGEYGDYWQYAGECVARGFGDCEDIAFVVIAVLRRDGYRGSIWFAYGFWIDSGHAWVVLPDEGLEISNAIVMQDLQGEAQQPPLPDPRPTNEYVWIQLPWGGWGID